MHSHRDKKNNTWRHIATGGFFLVIVFILVWAGVFSGPSLRKFGGIISYPFLALGESFNRGTSSVGYFFESKKNLAIKNDSLLLEIENQKALLLDRNILSDENTKLKEAFGRKKDADMVLATILAKPNQSIYDTIILDVGDENQVSVGDTVFAYGTIPFAEITEVFAKSSKARIFSASGVETSAIVSGTDVYVTLVGRGSGSFEAVLPRDFPIEKGMLLTIPNLNPYILAEAIEVISDPRDPEKKVIMRSPVLLSELKFVQVFRTNGLRVQ